MASPTVRPIRDDEFAAWIAVPRVAMMVPPAGEEAIEVRRQLYPAGRNLAAFDQSGTMCGAARSFPTELSVPGGAVPAAAVSAVGVLPTHRRQGHLNRLMQAQLADVAERGEPVAILIAAEYPIYGRYGYGPLTDASTLHIDALTAELRDPPTGSVALVDNKAFHDAIVEVYARTWRRTPGHITWAPAFFEIAAGLRDLHDGQDDERRGGVKAVWRDADGVPQAVAAYAVSDNWVQNRPRGELRTSFLAAATDEGERELFRYLSSVDWVSTVRANPRPVDEPFPLRLVDGRAAAVVDRFDHIWARILDVPAALGARTYAVEGELVVEVVDPLGFAEGRFALAAGPDGATCRPTRAEPDVTVPVGALGAAYLGGHSWAVLAATGWVDERRPGAVARASSLFSTLRAPWCSTGF